MSTYYVVHKGKKPGIYKTWTECKKQITNFDGAIFKKFNNSIEAGEFLVHGFPNGKKPLSVTKKENDDKKNYESIETETGNDLDESEKIFIYTDGSCTYVKNNPTKAGYGIYIPEKNISVGLPLLNQKLTNNRAELTAIIESIKYLDNDDLEKKICIFTDSQYSMYIFNGTGERYEKNNWKNNGNDVPNIDLIKKILELKRKYNIVLLKVRAHTNREDDHSQGNKIADNLANDGANSTSKAVSANIFTKNNNCGIDDFENVDEDSKINKNIQMNELFDFDKLEVNDSGIDTIFNNNNNNKKLKNQKLSNWFVKK
jgi:ribonuclease HI